MSNINAKNIISENIIVTNLNVTYINGSPYVVNPCNDPCKKGYYVPCPDCDFNGPDNCDCGNTCDWCVCCIKVIRDIENEVKEDLALGIEREESKRENK